MEPAHQPPDRAMTCFCRNYIQSRAEAFLELLDYDYAYYYRFTQKLFVDLFLYSLQSKIKTLCLGWWMIFIDKASKKKRIGTGMNQLTRENNEKICNSVGLKNNRSTRRGQCPIIGPATSIAISDIIGNEPNITHRMTKFKICNGPFRRINLT